MVSLFKCGILILFHDPLLVLSIYSLYYLDNYNVLFNVRVMKFISRRSNEEK